MNLRHGLLTLAAALHLGLVLCGALRLELVDAQTDAGRGVRLVQAYAGSDANFGFFAPGVSDEIRAVFVLIDGQGRTWEDTLDAHMTREARLRVGTGVSVVAEHPDLIPTFGQSWAATMLGRHPTAVTVVVRVEGQAVPTMQEHQQGERRQWQLLYECAFQRETNTTYSTP